MLSHYRDKLSQWNPLLTANVELENTLSISINLKYGTFIAVSSFDMVSICVNQCE